MLTAITFKVSPDVLQYPNRKRIFLEIEDDPVIWQFIFLQDSENFGEASYRNMGCPAPDWASFISKRMAFVAENEGRLSPEGLNYVALVTITDEDDLTSQYEAAGAVHRAHPASERSDYPTVRGRYAEHGRCLIIR